MLPLALPFMHGLLQTMLIRIVRMTFRPNTTDTFLDHFDTVAPRIRKFPGCLHLELWQDEHYANQFTTCSHWDDGSALQQYRESDLFQSTWADVKPLFAARPKAFSYRRIRRASE